MQPYFPTKNPSTTLGREGVNFQFNQGYDPTNLTSSLLGSVRTRLEERFGGIFVLLLKFIVLKI